MELIADMILGAGAFCAAFYCYVLSRRLKRFTDLESGVGGAVERLSQRVEHLTRALSHAKSVAQSAESNVTTQTARAEETVRKLELLIASTHDLVPSEPQNSQGAPRGWS